MIKMKDTCMMIGSRRGYPVRWVTAAAVSETLPIRTGFLNVVFVKGTHDQQTKKWTGHCRSLSTRVVNQTRVEKT